MQREGSSFHNLTFTLDGLNDRGLNKKTNSPQIFLSINNWAIENKKRFVLKTMSVTN